MPTLIEALAGVVNATEITPTLVTGGQPGPRHLEALKVAGAQVILDLRDPMEARAFDEPAAVRALGLEYINIPVASGAIDDTLLERILEVARRSAERPMLVHCASGNRVTGPLLAYLMIDRGMDEDAATELAMRMGLRSPEMLEWGVEYARRVIEG
ncbi:MAG TPA: sulfur transferase domain-containing protein [Gemmatimonadales bacterium]|nr:sulfur transferase domain-containing protein [Gemmatimonadales bacterium]